MKGILDENSDKISCFLRDNLGLYYCDDCLQEEMTIASRNQVNRIKRILLTLPQEFDQGTECDSCSRNMKTIAYLPRIY